jgi:hypothetical protein
MRATLRRNHAVRLPVVADRRRSSEPGGHGIPGDTRATTRSSAGPSHGTTVAIGPGATSTHEPTSRTTPGTVGAGASLVPPVRVRGERRR